MGKRMGGCGEEDGVCGERRSERGGAVQGKEAESKKRGEGIECKKGSIEKGQRCRKNRERGEELMGVRQLKEWRLKRQIGKDERRVEMEGMGGWDK